MKIKGKKKTFCINSISLGQAEGFLRYTAAVGGNRYTPIYTFDRRNAMTIENRNLPRVRNTRIYIKHNVIIWLYSL